jgi:phosphoribosyl 1,2-cyclic phosphate phosphodiesterase
MQLTFLGTGTSVGVPMIGCRCAVCTSADTHNQRLRTSALLDVDELSLLIDAGPDFRTQALRAGLVRLDAVLLTHHHADHIGGIDDLRPFTMRERRSIPIYGSRRTLDDVRERFAYAFSDEPSQSTRPSLQLRPVDGPFRIGSLAVEPLDVLHGTNLITGYRLGSLAYITDASALPEATLTRLGGLEVLVLNALRHSPHPLHFSLSQALDVIDRLRPQRAFLVHIAHDLEHMAVNATLPPNVALAYDGLSIKV